MNLSRWIGAAIIAGPVALPLRRLTSRPDGSASQIEAPCGPVTVTGQGANAARVNGMALHLLGSS